jgi:uncharacterized membrane protein
MHEGLDILILVCLGIVFAVPIFPFVTGLLWIISYFFSAVPFSWFLIGIISIALGIMTSFLILSD